MNRIINIYYNGRVIHQVIVYQSETIPEAIERVKKALQVSPA